jgi:hypothetical protein
LSSGRIKFTDEQDVTELVRENYDTEYYADQLAADDVECDLGYTQVIMTFIVTWIFRSRICGMTFVASTIVRR